MNTQSTPQTPAAAVVVTHEVADFDIWKRAFDGNAAMRRSAGIVATHVNRHADAPQRLSVYLAGDDAVKLEAFLTSRDLMQTMREAGVQGPPHVAAVTPVEDRTVKDRPLAGLILRHEVKDFDAWKRGFDAHVGARTAAGILGHAVNRSQKVPNTVVVYLQAETLDVLRAFAGNPDLGRAMEAAGVISAPELTFVNGGDWAS